MRAYTTGVQRRASGHPANAHNKV